MAGTAMRDWIGGVIVLMLGVPAMPATAAPSSSPVADVRAPAPPSHAVSEYRLKPATAPADPTLRIDDPRSMLQTGFGGALTDLFPISGSKFHLSAGGRLFGRAGRPRAAELEPLRPLPPFRAGMLRGGRKFSPTMLVGYGRTVERGLAFGFDAGVVMGKLGATPDRFGHFNRRRLESLDGRGGRRPMNQIARVTALYRF